ncbi:PREDICTED: phospholipid transfer protein-like [Cyprinodon variegatus]|uniref:phospholipid transfer protein-like n=1 Tax=Cyprinodon variegatus TaxID=28743 RepID=UPI00074294AB|nr:PREDICTED: phospholipid transfer protein-like [Cyprinodon variegatus]
MEVGLTRTADGRLEAAMRNCKVSTDQLQIVGTGLPRIAEGALEKLLIYLVCTLINQKGISALNSYLSTAPMVADVFPDLGIKLDYSLTRDIQVTTQSLDMSFKGQAYVQNQPPLMEKGGVEPVFKENNMMAYVGITEFFFSSAARSFYDAGIMSKKFEIKSKIGKAALRIIQFFTQPWNLRESLQTELKLIEAPTIKITQADGIIFNIRVAGSVISSGSRKPTVLSLSVVCPGSMMITIEGDRLFLPSKDFNCQVESKSVFNKKLNKKINKKIQEFLSDWFGEGWKIPFPEGMNFIQGTVQYQNGFVVVGGDLRFTPAGREKVFKKIISGT